MSLCQASPLRVILGIFATIALFTIFGSSSTPKRTLNAVPMASREDPGFLASIDVALQQSSSSPPTVTVKVTNNNDHPVTILSYNSPLDGLAFKLGLLSLTPDGATEPANLHTIQIRRLWPPPADSLITLAPGASATNDLALGPPVIPKDGIGERASAVLKGRYMGVWPREKDTITKKQLEDLHTSEDFATGDFVSNTIDVSLT